MVKTSSKVLTETKVLPILDDLTGPSSTILKRGGFCFGRPQMLKALVVKKTRRPPKAGDKVEVTGHIQKLY